MTISLDSYTHTQPHPATHARTHARLGREPHGVRVAGPGLVAPPHLPPRPPQEDHQERGRLACLVSHSVCCVCWGIIGPFVLRLYTDRIYIYQPLPLPNKPTTPPHSSTRTTRAGRPRALAVGRRRPSKRSKGKKGKKRRGKEEGDRMERPHKTEIGG